MDVMEFSYTLWIDCCLYLYDNCLCYYFFFFFQAEDGIRDLTVTGVQTCALPIWQQAGDERGELVVVAKLEFRKRNCIVFVDDGNDAAVQQGDQCVAGVEMALMEIGRASCRERV